MVMMQPCRIVFTAGNKQMKTSLTAHTSKRYARIDTSGRSIHSLDISTFPRINGKGKEDTPPEKATVSPSFFYSIIIQHDQQGCRLRDRAPATPAPWIKNVAAWISLHGEDNGKAYYTLLLVRGLMQNQRISGESGADCIFALDSVQVVGWSIDYTNKYCPYLHGNALA